MTDNEKIIHSARLRGIEYFVHFTNVTNLPNILTYGLLTKDTLDYNWIDYDFNDDLRLDDISNSISLSITSPNYKMFYKLRCENPSKKWVVLILNAYEILKLDCAFCHTNAANSSISNTSIDSRKTYTSFKNMFSERPGQLLREQLDLYDNETTDPQAEILVLDNIPSSAIQFAVFNNYIIKNQYENLFIDTNISYAADSGYFAPRRDYSFW